MWAKLFFLNFLFINLSFGGVVNSNSPSLNDVNSTDHNLVIPKSFLKFYQYKTADFTQNKSPIVSPYFFFAKDGFTHPTQELKAAIEAYSHDESIYGVQNTYAACAFPARKYILEKELNLKFPQIDCPDLQEWVKKINANAAAIVFAGAYKGNPASIMGHTFIRFYNKENEIKKTPLLSYAVGFMALPNAQDNKLIYMYKGLTGGYPGGYEIEPFYQKVGLYNNSESRDLWEYELLLSPEEVHLLILSLWEYTFNAQMPYYFVDENCSYRLTKLIEIVKPELNFDFQNSVVILPAETLRGLQNLNLVDHLSYRASLKTKLDYKISKMSHEQLTQFQVSKKNKESLKNQDSLVLDSLIDYWSLKNYKNQAQLTPEETVLYNETLLQRAHLNQESRVIDNQQIKEELHKSPPFLGHLPALLNINASAVYWGMQYYLGVHGLNSAPNGYEDTTLLQYLGFSFKGRYLKNEKYNLYKKTLVSLDFIEALSLDNFNLNDLNWSWKFNSHFKNYNSLEQAHNQITDANLVFEAGAGLAKVSTNNFAVYLFPLIHNSSYREQSSHLLKNKTYLGYEIGLYQDFFTSYKITTDWMQFYQGSSEVQSLDLALNYFINLNTSIQLHYQHQKFNFQNNEDMTSIELNKHF